MWNPPTKNQLSNIPELYATEETPLDDKIIYMHFFIGACDWYISEYDGNDLFWGYANLGDDLNAEWGYVSFKELKQIKIFSPIVNGKTKEAIGKLPVEVDHDLYWNPSYASDISKIIFIDPL